MTSTKDWVLILPAEGKFKETIRELLALADSPTDVRTQGNTDLLVAPYVAAALDRPKSEPRPRSRRKKEEA